MEKMLAIVFGLLVLGGCANLDKLLTLEGLSSNQDAQRADVKKQNKQFGLLLQAVKDNRLSDYPDQKSFAKAFGDPIYTRKITRDDRVLEQWLYRYTQQLMGAEKVYVYFDENGKFVNFYQVVPAKETGSQKERPSTEDGKT